MLTVRGVLHPTDFSDLSNNAFRLACCLALDYQAPLYVLHVATAFEAFEGELIFKKRSAHYLATDWEKLSEYKWPALRIHCLLAYVAHLVQKQTIFDAVSCKSLGFLVVETRFWRCSGNLPP